MLRQPDHERQSFVRAQQRSGTSRKRAEGGILRSAASPTEERGRCLRHGKMPSGARELRAAKAKAPAPNKGRALCVKLKLDGVFRSGPDYDFGVLVEPVALAAHSPHGVGQAAELGAQP